MSPSRWTSKSTLNLARALTKDGHRVCDFVVRRLLRELGYSLQANAKTTEGGRHPDRDAQFGYLNDQAQAHMDASNPAISVDTKKKLRHEVAAGVPTRGRNTDRFRVGGRGRGLGPSHGLHRGGVPGLGAH